MKINKSRTIRIGFDLDGVLLYNPARIIRPVVYLVKKLLFQKNVGTFWVPQKPWEQYIWLLFHKSSIFPAPGIPHIKTLVKQNRIKAYLITGRYNFLKKDLEQWIKNMNLTPFFESIHYNAKNEQPHLFKERTIKKLKLDYFVEDNWDIVEYLNSQKKNNATILWIYNIFDRGIDYKNKFPHLKKAIESIKF